MLTLYHAPNSRSTRIVGALMAMDALDKVDIVQVDIPRRDGTGRHDPANPHPEGKVPVLVHDGVEIWESSAILLYLTELFPEAGLGIPPGDRERGRSTLRVGEQRLERDRGPAERDLGNVGLEAVGRRGGLCRRWPRNEDQPRSRTGRDHLLSHSNTSRREHRPGGALDGETRTVRRAADPS